MDPGTPASSLRDQIELYRPSGRLGEPFALAAFALLGLGAVCGGIEAFIYSGDPLMAWFLTMALGFWLGLAGTFAVHRGRCRNRYAAALLGLLATATLFATAFLIDQYQDWGKADPAQLGAYIEWRVETGRHLGRDGDTVRETPTGDPGAKVYRRTPLPEPWLSLSWAGFAGGLVVTFFFATLLPWRFPRTLPYCETCDAWMSRDVFSFAAGSSAMAMDALAEGRLAERLEQLGKVHQPGIAATLVALHSCGAEHGCEGRTGWVSLAEGGKAPSMVGPFHPTEQLFGRLSLELGRMLPVDLEAVRPRLGSSRDGEAYLAESKVPDYLSEAQDAADPHQPAPSASVIADFGPRAEIEDIGDRTAGALLEKRPVITTILVQLLPIPLVFAGLMGVFWALEEGGSNPLAALLAVPSALLLLTTLATFLRDVHYFEGLLPYWQARLSFADRTDRLVEANDRDAFFVDVIPRANWARTMVENASDIGFLKIDEAGRQLLFEGDRQRYRIPGDRITGLEITGLGHSMTMMGIETSLRHVVIVHVDSGDRSVEIPLVLRHTRLWPTLRWGRSGNFGRLITDLVSILAFDVANGIEPDVDVNPGNSY